MVELDEHPFRQIPEQPLCATEYNRKSAGLIGCGITSNLKNDLASVLNCSSDLSVGVMPRPSRIRVDQKIQPTPSATRLSYYRRHG